MVYKNTAWWHSKVPDEKHSIHMDSCTQQTHGAVLAGALNSSCTKQSISLLRSARPLEVFFSVITTYKWQPLDAAVCDWPVALVRSGIISVLLVPVDLRYYRRVIWSSVYGIGGIDGASSDRASQHPFADKPSTEMHRECSYVEAIIEHWQIIEFSSELGNEQGTPSMQPADGNNQKQQASHSYLVYYSHAQRCMQ